MTGRCDERRVVLGRVAGLFGVHGWVKVHSDTQPRENILEYPVWQLGDAGGWQARRLIEGRVHGKGIVAQLEGCDDRATAAALLGTRIAVGRDELPPLADGEYYWTDLEGLRVRTASGRELGTVDRLMETGANDVLVVRGERERLIPFLPDRVVTDVDLEAGVMVVDWDPDF
ncbi:MAG TPA: ribosome maturation factor RimM [Gammaproteobacteria bacterium]|nr:ribosome maturation factor RimM [Gammaproteobacteria bacterium]